MCQLKKYIDKNRLYQLFSELVQLDSVTFQERKSADYVKNYLKDLDVEVYEDEAWRESFDIVTDDQGNKKAIPFRWEGDPLDAGLLAGNVYAYIPGDLPGKPLIFSAHLDTVAPGMGKKAVLGEDNIIRSEGKTVLGSDDFAGIVQILEAVRLLKENGISHRSVELVFPVAEETYSQGGRFFDYQKLRAKEAYVLDLSGPVGAAAVQAPSIVSFRIHVKGRSAHAGFAPEEGIHAIRAASEAVSKLKLGRIGTEATRNIGMIQGGTARNIIPDSVVLDGEIRSYCHEEAMKLLEETKRVFQAAAKKNGARVIVDFEVQIKAYQTDKDDPVTQRFLKVCREMGIDPELKSTFGGSDHNIFADRGIRGIVLSCGMQQVHTTEEFICLEDLYLGTALVMGLMTAEK